MAVAIVGSLAGDTIAAQAADGPVCIFPEARYEDYGPTDINVQAGDNERRVTVNANAEGTVTVFKWPNPSFYNQVKYLAVSRDEYGKASTKYPNEGAFLGIRYRTAEGIGFSWLRDWKAIQRYNSPDTSVPVTIYHSPASLGLRVTNFDLVNGDTFQRQFLVMRKPGSPVQRAQLVSYENFNPIATHFELAPLADWCWTSMSDQDARYAPGHHAILNWWDGVDDATGQPSSVALAMGFDRPDVARQVGADGYDPGADPDGPDDPYDQLSRPGHWIGGSTSAQGQTTGALIAALHFDRRDRATARFTVAAGETQGEAVRSLNQARRTGFAAQLRADQREWQAWLRRTRIPKTTDGRVRSVSKRALILLRLAMVPETGAIVASSATQGPYGLDWIRDGAFFNEVLDRNGFKREVTLHNRFYVDVQTSPDNPSPLRPDGNWPMASYGDGVDGAPIPWEIDETGFGIWTLYRHALYLKNEKARQAYLDEVYPAIVLAADFLTTCRDPENGLQCRAHEDDNYNLTQTIQGAQTVLLGMRAAVQAAALVGDTSERVDAWGARRDELRDAIDRELFDPEAMTYLERADRDWPANFRKQGWLLWPVVIKPRSHPAMRATALNVYKGVRQALAADYGSYELKGILGLAHQWAPLNWRQANALKGQLAYMARALTTPTGLFGEAWERYADGWAKPVQDTPHVWMQILYYMAAEKIYGGERYGFQRGDFYQRHCRAGHAPARAC